MRFARYSRYKPSGVDWLGDVPTHWDIFRLKRCHRIVNGGTPSSGEESYWDGEINWITPEDLGKSEGKFIGASRRTLSLEGLRNCGAQLVPPESIVLSTRAPIGHVAVTEKESCTNQGCRALVSDERRAIASFVYYALTASRSILQASGKGTTFMELAAGALGAHAIPLPPIGEQRIIADFLDRETAKLDTLVEKKRALIEKLKEKRAALISRTVTRGLPPEAARAAGLDPHPKLKPSGVDWLGDVPEHWNITAVGYQFSNLDYKRIPVAGEDRAIVDKIYPYYGASGIIDYVEEYLFDEPLILVAEDGANLLSRSTPLAFLATGKFWVNNHAHILKPVDGDIRYWVAVLQTYDYTPLVTGAAQPKLTTDRLGGIRIPLPPSEEQRIIADFLGQETGKIDRMVEKVEGAITRLQEYRTALITAAVTGKIDVREAAQSTGAGAREAEKAARQDIPNTV
jgi:type I restriction enzyme S subunit